MFRKLVFAVALALGIGGSAVATGGAQAAVAPTTSNALVQAIEHGAPSVATDVRYRRRWGGYHRYHRGWGYRRGWGYHRRWGYRRWGYRPYYYGYHRCRWVLRRAYFRYRWVWVRRRVCW